MLTACWDCKGEGEFYTAVRCAMWVNDVYPCACGIHGYL